MGLKKHHAKKQKINVRQDTLHIDFLYANRQFDWLELPLVYDKSNKHNTVYNSYNVEMVSKKIKSVKLTNFTEIYSLTSKKKKKNDIDNLTKYISCSNNLLLGAAMDLALLH